MHDNLITVNLKNVITITLIWAIGCALIGGVIMAWDRIKPVPSTTPDKSNAT